LYALREDYSERALERMNEREEPPITITQADIVDANRLSLHCPICAGAVEQHIDGVDVAPVICTDCGTLYHLACWEQNGGNCAILGCESQTYRRHGVLDLGPVMTISRRDIQRAPAQPRPVPVASANSATNKKQKNEQGMYKEMQRRFRLRDFFQNLLRAIRIWPSDPSS